jgi:hypothetical protein
VAEGRAEIRKTQTQNAGLDDYVNEVFSRDGLLFVKWVALTREVSPRFEITEVS